MASRVDPASQGWMLGAQVALAWVCSEQCDPGGAEQWVVRARDSLDRNSDPLLAPILVILRAQLLRSTGHRAEALELLDGAEIESGPVPRWVRQHITVEAASIRLALQNAAEPSKLPDVPPDQGDSSAQPAAVYVHGLDGRSADVVAGVRLEPDVAPPVGVDAWLTRARTQLAIGDRRGAATAVQRALRIAEPEQLRRPFIESTTQVRKLIRGGLPGDTPMPRWLDPTNGATKSAGRGCRSDVPYVPVQVPALTGRELDVLTCLAQMLSTTEIAGALFVSVNTVRSHVRSILRKFDAPRRSVAVRRARELELL